MTRTLVLLGTVASLLALTGCGSGLTPVTGVVTLDGKPVAGATITMASDDGKYNASGVTDESGNFTIESQDGPGARRGNYKVAVAKYPKVENAASPADAPGGVSKDYANQMKKEAEAGKAAGAPKMPAGAKMMPGMPMPGGGARGSGAKSELPEVYASLEKTPLTITVPTEGPVKLELKSK